MADTTNIEPSTLPPPPSQSTESDLEVRRSKLSDTAGEDGATTSDTTSHEPPNDSLRTQLPAQLLTRLSVSPRKAPACSFPSSSTAANENLTESSDSENLHSAQSLRRRKIIELRRAKLISRSDHVQEVLRRAQALATVDKSIVDDKTKKAEALRQKLLDEKVRKGAQEVERAKQIASTMKRRWEEEHDRKERRMREREEGAQRRRDEYLEEIRRSRRTSRRLSNDSPERKKKHPSGIFPAVNRHLAARKIQRFWRHVQQTALIRDFDAAGLSLNAIVSREGDFESWTEQVQKPELIKKTEQLLKLCLSTKDADSPPDSRMFLAAYLMARFPEQVIRQGDDMDPQEVHLLDQAVNMLGYFERVLARLRHLQDTSQRFKGDELSQSFQDALKKYNTVFLAWKTHDQSSLVEVMLSQFAELERLLLGVTGDIGNVRGSANFDEATKAVIEEYSAGVKHNQTLILAKLKGLLGKERAMQAVRETMAVVRSTSPRTHRRASRTGASMDFNAMHLTESAPSPEQSEEQLSAAVADSLTRLFAVVPSNLEFLHAVNLDPTWNWDPQRDHDARERQIEREARRKTIEHIRRDLIAALAFPASLQSPAAIAARAKTVRWTRAIARLVRNKFLAVIPNGGKTLTKVLENTIDLDLIDQQAQQGTFSYEQFFKAVGHLLKQFSSPARDNDIKRFLDDSTGDFAEKTEQLISLLQNLVVDFTNVVLLSSKETLLREGLAYEQRMLDRSYGPGVQSLVHTRKVWNHAKRALPVESQNTGDIHKRFIVESFVTPVQLVLAVPTPNVPNAISLDPAKSLAETLTPDWTQIKTFRRDVLRLMTLTALMITTRNLLPRNSTTHSFKPQMNRLWALSVRRETEDLDLNDISTWSASYLSVLETCRPKSSESPLSTLPGLITSILEAERDLKNSYTFLDDLRQASVASAASKEYSGRLVAPRFVGLSEGVTHPLLKLIQSRLQSYFYKSLAAKGNANDLAELKGEFGKLGFGEVIERMEQMGRELRTIAVWDFRCKSAWYRAM